MTSTPPVLGLTSFPLTDLTVAESGAGRPVLLLHGGGGPFTVAGLGAHLAEAAHVLTPTHPGWNGTPRPAWLDGVADLAATYLRLLRERGLRDVVVVGSSLGGWTAAEMALGDDEGLIGGLVLINAVGVRVESEPVADFYALSPREVAEHSFHDPDRFFVDPSQLPPDQIAVRQADMATMRAIAGDDLNDPGLLARLKGVHVPALVLWGESDRIAPVGYGAAYAAAFGNADFQLVREAGHLPQLEQPAATFAAIDAFLTTSA